MKKLLFLLLLASSQMAFGQHRYSEAQNNGKSLGETVLPENPASLHACTNLCATRCAYAPTRVIFRDHRGCRYKLTQILDIRPGYWDHSGHRPRWIQENRKWRTTRRQRVGCKNHGHQG